MRLATNHRPDILKQAARFFATKPYHEVLMDDVAAAVGIAKGTIYRFYRNKDLLYLSVCLEWMDTHAEQLREASVGSDNTLIRLERMVLRSALHFRAYSDFFQAVQRADVYPNITGTREFLRRRGKVREQFARVIAQGQTQNLIRKMDASMAADMLLGMIRSLQRFGDPSRSAEQNAQGAMDVFLNGTKFVSQAPDVTKRKVKLLDK